MYVAKRIASKYYRKGDVMQMRKSTYVAALVSLITFIFLTIPSCLPAVVKPVPAPGSKLEPADENIIITEADVTVERVGTSIPGF